MLVSTVWQSGEIRKNLDVRFQNFQKWKLTSKRFRLDLHTVETWANFYTVA